MTIVSLTEPTEFAEKRTLLFKKNRQYEAESRGETEGSRQEEVK